MPALALRSLTRRFDGVTAVDGLDLEIARGAGVLVLSVGLVLALGLALWIVDLIVLQIGLQLFDRDRLAADL